MGRAAKSSFFDFHKTLFESRDLATLSGPELGHVWIKPPQADQFQF
jgi:hypothetical protein